MKIHYFTKGGNTVASSRQRAFLVRDQLLSINVPCEIHRPYQTDFQDKGIITKLHLVWSLIKELKKIKRGDVLVLQRTVYNKFFFGIMMIYLLLGRVKSVFDFDDAIFIYPRLALKAKILVKLTDVTTVGSHELKNWAEQYSEKVFLIPTSTPFSCLPSTNSGDIFTIGWVGYGPGYLEELELLKPVFKGLVAKNLKFKVLLVGAFGSKDVRSFFDEVKGLNIEFVDYCEPDKISEKIQLFDIGLMPLLDSTWDRGKCALKAVEYMACSVPAIISDVGENSYLLKDGKGGFLVKSTEDWVRSISLLYEDPKMLARMSIEAKERIGQNYSIEHFASLLLEIVSSISKTL